MKSNLTHLDQWRTQDPPYTSEPGDTVGMFIIPHPSRKEWDRHKTKFYVLCGDASHPVAQGWEHVSAHMRYIQDGEVKQRTPTWEEMAHLKSLFFRPQECVVEFHVPEVEHINVHPHVLHLWHLTTSSFPQPPMMCV